MAISGREPYRTGNGVPRLGCPEQAITKVPRRFVALLEYAMAKSKPSGLEGC